MHHRTPFEREIQRHLPRLLRKLMRSRQFLREDLGQLNIPSGAYLFSCDERPMYIGIVGPHSQHGIRQRVRQHQGGTPAQAPLPSHMTKNTLGLDPAPTNAQIAARYMREFRAEQALVQQMEVRAIAVPETPGCALLASFEIFAAVNLQTPYNDFCTH